MSVLIIVALRLHPNSEGIMTLTLQRASLPADRGAELTLQAGRGQAGDAPGNRLLAALPAAIWERWQSHLEAVDLPLGKVLCEPGCRLAHVVFPTTAIVSMQYRTEDGHCAEIAVIGNEGMVGTWLVMGGGTVQAQAVVQSAGRGLRMGAAALLEEFNRAGPVMHLLLRYTQALMTQAGQTAVCNRHHDVEQRLCHWLLLTLDRQATNRIAMTQELMANMMGVRRESVTEASCRLHEAGLIDYHRGQITVLDRLGLEEHSCECYHVIRDEYDRLLPAQVAD